MRVVLPLAAFAFIFFVGTIIGGTWAIAAPLIATGLLGAALYYS